MTDDEDKKGEVIPFKAGQEIIPLTNEVEEDIQQAKEDIREIARIGIQAVADAQQLASAAQRASLYMALSSVMKATLDANKDLIEIHQKKKELETIQSDGPQHVTNQLVLTTDQVLDKLLGRNDEDV